MICRYNYGREDEEIYKEFLEIANELIPHIVKVVSSNGCEPSGHADVPLLKDPECFAHLLRFYDGLCEWEEGSSTPVLHIGWAKPLVSTISKFPGKVRCMVDITAPEKKPDPDPEATDCEKSDGKKHHPEKAPKSGKENSINGSGKVPKTTSNRRSASLETEKAKAKKKAGAAGQESEFIQSLETQINSDEEPPHPNIMALAAACGDNILNPEYLLGSGEPFSSRSSSSSSEGPDCFSHKANGTSVVPDINTADPGLDIDTTTSFLQVCDIIPL